MEIKKHKQLLRKKFITKRGKLEAEGVNKRSEKIASLLIHKIDWAKIKKLHCFLPISESNEPDMRLLIKHVEKHGVEVFATVPNAPVAPVDSAITDYSLGDDVQFDLVIVPMLAYDPHTKHRLGFGGGFYDRLLAQQPQATSIGVCFKEFAEDNLPVDPHDQPLQKIFAV